MSRSAVKVVLRTRPSDSFPTSQLQISPGTKSITVVHNARTSGLPSDKAGPPQQYQFKFDGVLHNATQEEVFELCAADVVQGALEGYNSTVMCYGQTGAGKTYTMTGDRQSYRQRGLIPRSIATTLSQLSSAPGVISWQVAVSYLEVYNEAMYDLLDISTQPHELSLYEDARGQTQVSGLRKVTVSNEAEALALFFEGESNRVIGEHQLNRESSRSHSIFMMHITTVPEGGDGQTKVSKLFLVDLAGSERVSKTGSEGLVLREAGHINKSLHILEQVVLAASQRGRDHVPYRSSKLTHVLKDSLGGNCRTVLIANIWGDAAQLDETLSTCRFSARMARLVCEVRSNVVQEGGARVRALEREVQELKEELAMMQIMNKFVSTSSSDSSTISTSTDHPSYQPYSDAARERLRESVLTWLQQPDGGDDDMAGDVVAAGLAGLQISSVRQLREVLLAVKTIMRQLTDRYSSSNRGVNSADVLHQTDIAVRNTYSGAASDTAAAAAAGSSSSSRHPNWQKYVGDGDDHSEAAAAPDDARPAGYEEQQQQQQQQLGSNLAADDPAGPGPGSLLLQRQQQVLDQHYNCANKAGGRPGSSAGRLSNCNSTRITAAAAAVPDVTAALEMYRSGPGAERAALLNDNAARLKGAKKRSKELAVKLNDLKRQLDAARAALDQRKQQRLAQGQEPDELSQEEYQFVMDIRDTKAQYRDGHAELQLVRDEVQYTGGLLKTCKAELLEGFRDWFRTMYGVDVTEGVMMGDASCYTSAAGSLLSRAESNCSTKNVLSSNSGEYAAAVGDHKPSAASGTRSSQAAAAAYSNNSSRQATPPLASLVGSLADDGDPEAAAYYQAQLIGSGSRLAGHRPGSFKKHRGELGTFTLSERSTLFDNPRSRVG